MTQSRRCDLPIDGLTNSQFALLPQIGELRKGSPKVIGSNGKEQMGKDLDHFRFTSSDPEAVAKMQAAYGDKPRQVKVFLPFETVDENWEAWIEQYTAGSLQHRCTGKWIVRELRGTKHVNYQIGEVPCPGHAEKDGSKPTGRLKVVVPELGRLAYVMVKTSSIWDCHNIDGQLRAAEQQIKLIDRERTLQGVPFILSRREQNISTPGFGNNSGKRQRTTKWLLSIEIAPEWVLRQFGVMQQLMLPGGNRLALPAGPGEAPTIVDQVTGEIEGPAGPIVLAGIVSGLESKRNRQGQLAQRFAVSGQVIIAVGDVADPDLAEGDEVIVAGTPTASDKLGPYIAATSVEIQSDEDDDLGADDYHDETEDDGEAVESEGMEANVL